MVLGNSPWKRQWSYVEHGFDEDSVDSEKEEWGMQEQDLDLLMSPQRQLLGSRWYHRNDDQKNFYVQCLYIYRLFIYFIALPKDIGRNWV